jgi:hypothetical protein
MPNLNAFVQISQFRRCRLTCLLCSLPDPRMPILNAFFTNILIQMLPVDLPDRQEISASMDALNMPGGLNMPDGQYAKCTSGPMNGRYVTCLIVSMPGNLPDRQLARSRDADSQCVMNIQIQMLPGDLQQAGWRMLILMFCYKFPNSDIAG